VPPFWVARRITIASTNVTFLDTVILNATERFCHWFQRMSGRTNVWLAVQLTNLSVIVYFVWAALYFWQLDWVLRITVGLFCGGVLYVLTQTVFKVPIEESENYAYRRVMKGYRNPRRVRDVLLRTSFLTLSIVLALPLLFAYATLRIRIALLSYFLVVLMTVLVYLLACDPLPPCAGKVHDWLRRAAGARSRAPERADARTRSALVAVLGAPAQFALYVLLRPPLPEDLLDIPARARIGLSPQH
jgi:hypothetical protein